MDRVKIPSGSVQKLEDVFDDLQTLVHGNLNKRIDALTGTNTYGVINALKNGEQVASDTSLKVAITSISNMELTISPGVGLLADGSIILVESAFTVNLDDIYSGTVAANTYYQISLKWKEVGTDPIVAMNAFFFDKAGLTPYAERFSRWSDSYEVVAYIRLGDTAIENTEDEIQLAIIKTSTIPNELLELAYTYSDPSE